MGLWLAKDGTFILVAGNSFASAGLEGTYSQTADTVTLKSHALGDATSQFPLYVMHYKWSGPDTISTFFEQDPTETTIMTRDAQAPATASISNLPAISTDAGAPLDYNERSSATTCLTNLKELALASQMYIQDWDTVLPPSETWHEALTPYVKNEERFTCPAVAKTGGKGGYAYDSEIAGMRKDALGDIADVVLIFETDTLGIGVYAPTRDLLTKPRHDGKISVSYVDGHVKARTK